MSVNGINFAGLSTGIDTESVITQLLAIESRPKTIIQNQIQVLQQRQAAYASISAQLLGLQSSALTLNRLRAFDIVAATSSDKTAVSVSAQTGAETGSHTVVVNNLAKAHRISTVVQSSKDTPLGFSGQVLINGKAINLQASDSLTTLASNINSAQLGVKASIIAPSAGEYYLTISSEFTGVQSKISLSDTGGGNFLASTLGALGAGSGLRVPIGTTGAKSALFADSATSIGTLQGQTTPVSGTVTIGGGTVAIDLATDSLSAIAAKINAASIAGVTANVVQTTDPISGSTRQQLEIQGTQTFTDSNNILTNLGILQRDFATGRELTAAQDASFTIDGLSATRPLNTFSDVISGVTISLLKDGGASSNLTVSRDTETIKSNITGFVKAFNDTIDAIDTLSQFDPDTGSTGPLFGELAAQSIVNSLVQSVISPVSGLPSSLSLFSQIGITLGTNDRLVVSEGALDGALASNLEGVAQLLRAYGTASDPTLQFVSASADTKPSGSSGYAIDITQPATQAVIGAGAAQTTALASDEALTFGGPLFGTAISSTLTGGRSITLRAGSSLNDIVSQINGSADLSQSLSASIVGGKLTLTSKQYGSGQEFAVVSSIADTGLGDTSGIGNVVLSQKGKDVAGTINGEAATGSGQFLTGSQRGGNGTSNGSALGLQIRVTGTTAGSYGNLIYTSGIADVIKNYTTTQTDLFGGTLSTTTKELDAQTTQLQENIKQIDERLKNRETFLRRQFTAMEVAVAKIRAATTGLAQLAASTNNNNNS